MSMSKLQHCITVLCKLPGQKLIYRKLTLPVDLDATTINDLKKHIYLTEVISGKFKYRLDSLGNKALSTCGVEQNSELELQIDMRTSVLKFKKCTEITILDHTCPECKEHTIIIRKAETDKIMIEVLKRYVQDRTHIPIKLQTLGIIGSDGIMCDLLDNASPLVSDFKGKKLQVYWKKIEIKNQSDLKPFVDAYHDSTVINQDPEQTPPNNTQANPGLCTKDHIPNEESPPQLRFNIKAKQTASEDPTYVYGIQQKPGNAELVDSYSAMHFHKCPSPDMQNFLETPIFDHEHVHKYIHKAHLDESEIEKLGLKLGLHQKHIDSIKQVNDTESHSSLIVSMLLDPMKEASLSWNSIANALILIDRKDLASKLIEAYKLSPIN